MNVVQLDEDLNAKHLVNACNEEGKVKALRFPSSMRGVGLKDPDVISKLLPRGNLILTTDLRFADDWIEFIPDTHPGIVMIGQDDDAIQTMTTRIAQSMLFQFKGELNFWNDMDWKNSIVRVQERYVEIQHANNNHLISDCFLDRNHPKWAMEFAEKLGVNASRIALPGGN